MPDPLREISTRATPQTEAADDRQIRNDAGGYGYRAGDAVRVRRFLTLGTNGGTYYASERGLTRDNADVILRVARERGLWLVDEIVEVSTRGLAPRQRPALFALAVAAGVGDDDTRAAALAALPKVARTGTHLLQFAGYVEGFRGWGRGLRSAVAGWYRHQTPERLAYQLLKYGQREGWSHRDLLRLAHPGHDTPAQAALYEYTVRGTLSDDLPALVHAAVTAHREPSVSTWTRLVGLHDLSWEMLPDAALAERDVWRALVEHDRVPPTALLRQLPRLTRVGALDDRYTRGVVLDRLVDAERLRRARLHPVHILLASRTYTSGKSRGGLTWAPVRGVADALDEAFYRSFENVGPSGKRTLLALDVSASMDWETAGPVTAREAAAALAMATVAVEPHVTTLAFTTKPQVIDLSTRRRLDDILAYTRSLPFGGTDCAVPMEWARHHDLEVDVFVVYTDSQTWAGRRHPMEALRAYRQASGIDAKLCVAALTATDVSIADPLDPGTLDVAGFDASVPRLIAMFSSGELRGSED